MNAATVVSRSYELLDSINAADLGGWSSADLYTLVNDALQRICLDAAIIGAAGAQAVTAPAVTATLPVATLAVLDAAWSGDGLEIVEIRDFDNLDAYWGSDADIPIKIALEQHGLRAARLSPNPTSSGTLQTITTQAPPTLDSGTSLACPDLVEVVCQIETIASARRQEGQYQQLDTAAALQSFADLLKDSLRAVYGRAM